MTPEKEELQTYIHVLNEEISLQDRINVLIDFAVKGDIEVLKFNSDKARDFHLRHLREIIEKLGAGELDEIRIALLPVIKAEIEKLRQQSLAEGETKAAATIELLKKKAMT
jgi:hypothetical protein